MASLARSLRLPTAARALLGSSHPQHAARWLPATAAPTLSASARWFGAAAEHNVSITEACAKRINKVGDSSTLRLSVEGGGCSGFQYVFSLEDCVLQEGKDLVFEKDGATLLVDSLSIDFIEGATIDYEETMVRAASCGCCCLGSLAARCVFLCAGAARPAGCLPETLLAGGVLMACPCR